MAYRAIRPVSTAQAPSPVPLKESRRLCFDNTSAATATPALHDRNGPKKPVGKTENQRATSKAPTSEAPHQVPTQIPIEITEPPELYEANGISFRGVLPIANAEHGKVVFLSGATEADSAFWHVKGPELVRTSGGVSGVVYTAPPPADAQRAGTITCLLATKAHLWAAFSDSVLRVFDPCSTKLESELMAHSVPVTSMCSTPIDTTKFVGPDSMADQFVFTLDGMGGMVVQWRAGGSGPITKIRSYSLSSTTFTLLTASAASAGYLFGSTSAAEPTVCVWNFSNGTFCKQLSLGESKIAEKENVPAGCKADVNSHASVSAMVFTEDQHLWAGMTDGSISLWNVENSTCVKRLAEHSDPISSLVCLGGAQILSTSYSSVRIWSLGGVRLSAALFPPQPNGNTRSLASCPTALQAYQTLKTFRFFLVADSRMSAYEMSSVETKPLRTGPEIVVDEVQNKIAELTTSRDDLRIELEALRRVTPASSRCGTPLLPPTSSRTSGCSSLCEGCPTHTSAYGSSNPEPERVRILRLEKELLGVTESHERERAEWSSQRDIMQEEIKRLELDVGKIPVLTSRANEADALSALVSDLKEQNLRLSSEQNCHNAEKHALVETVDSLKRQSDEADAMIAQLKSKLDETTARQAELEAKVADQGCHLHAKFDEVQELTQMITMRDSTIATLHGVLGKLQLGQQPQEDGKTGDETGEIRTPTGSQQRLQAENSIRFTNRVAELEEKLVESSKALKLAKLRAACKDNPTLFRGRFTSVTSIESATSFGDISIDESGSAVPRPIVPSPEALTAEYLMKTRNSFVRSVHQVAQTVYRVEKTSSEARDLVREMIATLHTLEEIEGNESKIRRRYAPLYQVLDAVKASIQKLRVIQTKYLTETERLTLGLPKQGFEDLSTGKKDVGTSENHISEARNDAGGANELVISSSSTTDVPAEVQSARRRAVPKRGDLICVQSGRKEKRVIV